MNAHWQVKRLGDICIIDKMQGIHRGLPYVGLEDIESHTARFIGSVKPQSVKSSTFRFSREHVLYGRLRPYLNKVIAPEFDGHCSTEVFPIRPCSALSREYLLYWFLQDEIVDRINSTCTGARMPRADVQGIMEFEFLLPSPPEQQRIVGILDHALECIVMAKGNAEKNLRNSRALFEAFIQSALAMRDQSWTDMSIEEIVPLVTEITLPTIQPKTKWSTPVSHSYEQQIWSPDRFQGKICASCRQKSMPN